MITNISNKKINGKNIRSYNVIGRATEQTKLQVKEEIFANAFVETVEISPLCLTPRTMDCFVMNFPACQNALRDLDSSWVNDGGQFPVFAKDATWAPPNTNNPETVVIKGVGIPIQQNYSFAPLVIPVWSIVNGKIRIFFVNMNNGDVSNATGYMVRIIESDNRGQA